MSALILTSVLGVVLLYLGLFNGKRVLAPLGVLGLLGAIVLFVLDKQYVNIAQFSNMLVFEKNLLE